jgi:PilZ domain
MILDSEGGFVAESRTGKRFPLELPIRIQEAESAEELQATTGNVSSAGVYVRANAAWEIGSKVDFEITLPAEAAASDHDIRVRCQGRVVRVDQPATQGEHCGVACIIDKYHFVRK